jgi:hypothetical protein
VEDRRGSRWVLILIVAAIPLFVNVNTFKPLIEEQLTTALGRQTKLGDLRTCLKTESLTRICTDETDLRTGKSRNNDVIQGSFTPFRMTT